MDPTHTANTELTARQRPLVAVFDRIGKFSMQSLRDRIVVQCRHG